MRVTLACCLDSCSLFAVTVRVPGCAAFSPLCSMCHLRMLFRLQACSAPHLCRPPPNICCPRHAPSHHAGSQCTIAYTARLPDGTVFDARSEEDPLTFTTDEGAHRALPCRSIFACCYVRVLLAGAVCSCCWLSAMRGSAVQRLLGCGQRHKDQLSS